MNKTKIKGKHEEIIIPELEKILETYISPKWTPKQEQQLLRYGHLPIKKLMKFFPNRTVDSIKSKYYKLKREEENKKNADK